MEYISSRERQLRHDAGMARIGQVEEEAKVAVLSRISVLIKQLRDAGCPRSLYVEKTVKLSPRQARRWSQEKTFQVRDPSNQHKLRGIYGVTVVRGWYVVFGWGGMVITEEQMLAEANSGTPFPGSTVQFPESSFRPLDAVKLNRTGLETIENLLIRVTKARQGFRY